MVNTIIDKWIWRIAVFMVGATLLCALAQAAPSDYCIALANDAAKTTHFLQTGSDAAELLQKKLEAAHRDVHEPDGVFRTDEEAEVVVRALHDWTLGWPFQVPPVVIGRKVLEYCEKDHDPRHWKPYVPGPQPRGPQIES